jgi:hypothetical protein
LAKASNLFFEKACPEDNLRANTQRWLAEDLQKAAQIARDELHRIVSDESTIMWTLSPQRLGHVQELHDNRIKDMSEKLLEMTGGYDAAAIEAKIKRWLANHPDMIAIFETHDDLVAYYEVAMTRFIDNVGLQVIERILLGRKGPLMIFTPGHVVRTLGRDEEQLRRLAGESEDKIARRKDLENDLQNLNEAFRKAQTYFMR